MPHVFDLFWEVLFCVLTAGISPTKSMSTKNPKLGKTDRQFQIQFKGQVSMYIILYLYLFLPEIFLDVYIINVFDSDYLCKDWLCHMCVFGNFLLCSKKILSDARCNQLPSTIVWHPSTFGIGTCFVLQRCLFHFCSMTIV